MTMQKLLYKLLFGHKLLGYWKDYNWNSPYSLKDSIIHAETYSYPEEIVAYLENSPRYLVSRSIETCVITGELIGSVGIISDGDWIWTREYAFYVRKGMIKIPNAFIKHIKKGQIKGGSTLCFKMRIKLLIG